MITTNCALKSINMLNYNANKFSTVYFLRAKINLHFNEIENYTFMQHIVEIHFKNHEFCL